MVRGAVEVGNVEDVMVELEEWSGVTVRNGTITGGAGSGKWSWWWVAGEIVSFRKKNCGEIGGPGKCVEDVELRLKTIGSGGVDNGGCKFVWAHMKGLGVD